VPCLFNNSGFVEPALKVEPSIDDKTSGTGSRRNAPEAIAVDGRRRISEVGTIQYVDRIQSEFKFTRFLDLEPLQDIHVKLESCWSPDGAVSQRSDLSRLRIHKDDVTIGVHDRLVAVSRTESVERG
jgi:hypothetical protein